MTSARFALALGAALGVAFVSEPSLAQPAEPPPPAPGPPDGGPDGTGPADGAPPPGGDPAGAPPAGDGDPPAGPEGADPDGTPPAPTAPPAPGEPLIPPAPPPPAPAPPPLAPVAPTPPPVASEPNVAGDGSEEKPASDGGERTIQDAGKIGARQSDVYAEDWWSHSRPTFEFHGYYRVRAELFHHFALGRRDDSLSTIWAQPPDNDFISIDGSRNRLVLCGDYADDQNDPDVENNGLSSCEDNTQAGANMRFRINPELHISDNLRVMAQVDLLDNVVLGSTPDGYGNVPGAGGGYSVTARGGYAPTGAFSTTQWAPNGGNNSFTDSIQVKRVWGEYRTPIGLLRFGRMPSHWGLGILANAGDEYDSDWGSTADRIMFITGIKSFDLYFAGAWDFPNEGATSATANERGGQPYDLAQLDDVNQWVLVVVRRRDPELQKLELAQGDVVLNGGAYMVYRNQFLDSTGDGSELGAASSQINTGAVSAGYVRRGAQAFIPDLWFQFLYKKFRLEAEAAMVYGEIENLARSPGDNTDYYNQVDPTNNGWEIMQFGMAVETDFRAVEDKLGVGFKFGYATGDPDQEGLNPPREGLQPQLTSDRTFSTFRFNPDYRVDLILWRNIFSRVQGAYYFRPSIEYDFNRDKNGQRLGGGAAFIWSRASQFIQTPGNSRDLGIELDFKLYYQAKDGTLNDDHDQMGGFFTQLEYGVMFPLGGLDYLPGEEEEFPTEAPYDSETAHILRWYLGILF